MHNDELGGISCHFANLPLTYRFFLAVNFLSRVDLVYL